MNVPYGTWTFILRTLYFAPVAKLAIKRQFIRQHASPGADRVELVLPGAEVNSQGHDYAHSTREAVVLGR